MQSLRIPWVDRERRETDDRLADSVLLEPAPRRATVAALVDAVPVVARVGVVGGAYVQGPRVLRIDGHRSDFSGLRNRGQPPPRVAPVARLENAVVVGNHIDRFGALRVEGE